MNDAQVIAYVVNRAAFASGEQLVLDALAVRAPRMRKHLVSAQGPIAVNIDKLFPHRSDSTPSRTPIDPAMAQRLSSANDGLAAAPWYFCRCVSDFGVLCCPPREHPHPSECLLQHKS